MQGQKYVTKVPNDGGRTSAKCTISINGMGYLSTVRNESASRVAKL